MNVSLSDEEMQEEFKNKQALTLHWFGFIMRSLEAYKYKTPSPRHGNYSKVTPMKKTMVAASKRAAASDRRRASDSRPQGYISLYLTIF